MRYSIFGPDRAFRRVSEGAALSLADDETAVPDVPDGIGPGWRLENGAIVAPSGLLPTQPLPDISDRQFAQALAKWGVITKPEALAFVKRGEAPKALADAIAVIPDAEQRFDTDMEVSGATLFRRDHASTVMLAAMLGWTTEQMDELWQFAKSLD